MLCDDLEGWDGEGGGGRFKEGGMCILIADSRSAQHCKAIILQFKIKNIKE